MNKKKIIFISNSPNNYQYDFYLELSSKNDVEFLFYKKNISKNNYNWKFSEDNFKFINNKFNLIKYLLKKKPDLIIIGYLSKFHFILLFLSRFFKNLYFWKELPTPENNFLKRKIKNLFYKLFFNNAKGIFCIGKKALIYYKNINNNCHYLPYSVKDYKKNKKRVFKKINFIFIGQLIKRKSVKEIIFAFNKLSKKIDKINLTIIGSGYLGNFCEKASKYNKKVKFYGFQDQIFIKKKLYNSHILLQPSKYDGWSVVVSQGFNAGLAIIGTNQTNCIYDYVIHKKNGYVCKADKDSIYKSMLYYIKNIIALNKHMNINRRVFENSMMNTAISVKKIEKILKKHSF